MFDENQIRTVITAFALCGKCVHVDKYGTGLIHTTFVIHQFHDDQNVRYILQRINKKVFKDISALMKNIDLITTHMMSVHESNGNHKDNLRHLKIIRTSNNSLYHTDNKGECWRMFPFIENTITYDTITNGQQAYHAAHIFGSFQKSLVNFPAHLIADTIIGFHDMARRFLVFKKSISDDCAGRAILCKEEIKFILAKKDIFARFSRLHHDQILPRRIVHNDTKINNVLFSKEGDSAVCVIDLDTAMAGIVISDFGDLCRTSVNTTDENETDLTKIKIDLLLFDALVNGYLTSTRTFLTPVERSHLLFGFKAIVLEQAMRFLTDYLDGDTYYSIDYDDQNLRRACNQIKLVQEVIANEHKMQDIINACDVKF
jgi:thiamine kinase-like enzyme